MDRRALLALLSTAAWRLHLPSVSSGSRIAAAARPPRSRTAAPARVEALVLGTAQDGGVPQINCFRDHCARVRSGDAPAPRVASLGLLDGPAGKRFVIDAGPDFPAQLADLLAASPAVATRGRTLEVADQLHGILLTHAHIGHYLGLAQLGKESAAARGVPVWASAAMAAFLRDNAPWDGLVDAGYVLLHELAPGVTVRVSPGLEVTPYPVVHRQEYSDTFCYLVRGPERSLLYIPDADTWDGWRTPFEQLLATADVALIDGSFYSADELGHRFQGQVPHPPVAATVERLAGLDARPPIWFTHLNHTNPLWDPDAPQRDALPAGFDVASTGQHFAL